MTKEPKDYKISPEEFAMLADIFRLIPREIKTSEDVARLAPGELGIDYRRGEIAIRSPYTGKVFYPNNAERLKMLGRKIVPGTTKFNADLVHGISFYTDLIELDKLNEDLTPDSLIRQMHAPAVLYARVAYENYKGAGWPSAGGMCLCLKSTEEGVVIKYFADLTNTEYIGQYNPAKHLFEGWMVSGGNSDDKLAETDKGGDTAHVTIPGNITLEDLLTIYVTVNHPIHPGGSIGVNGIPPKPIIGVDGKPLDTEIVENTTIMLVYDQIRDAWVYLDNSQSSLMAMLQIVLERVANNDSTTKLEFTKLEQSFTAKINLLREQHDREVQEMKVYIDAALQKAALDHTKDIQSLNSTIQLLSDRLDMLEATVAKMKADAGDSLVVIDLPDGRKSDQQ